MVVVLPTPFTPTKSQTVGPSPSPYAEGLHVAFEHGDEIGLQCVEEGGRVRCRNGTVAQSGPKIIEDPCRGRDAHVGEDERLLELLEGRFVDPLAAEDLIEVTREQTSRAPETVPQLPGGLPPPRALAPKGPARRARARPSRWTPGRSPP